MSIPTRATAPKESTTYQKERSHQSRDTSCIISILKMSEKILSDGGGIYNDKKRTIRSDELQRNPRNKSGNDTDAETEASQESPRPRIKVKENNNRRVKTARKTNVENPGLANQTVRFSMKDEDNDSKSKHSN